jgi:hypothetical protein
VLICLALALPAGMVGLSVQAQLLGSFSPAWGEAGFAAHIPLPIICLANQGA